MASLLPFALTLAFIATLTAQTFEPQSAKDWMDDVSFPPRVDLRFELVASEPLLNGAHDLQLDEAGRLWVLGETQNEDTCLKVGRLTPEGTLTRLDTFAADLLPARTFTFVDDGILLPQGHGKTLWLGDSNGDHIADIAETRFTGWKPNAKPAHWQRGLDNWIWGTVGEPGFNNPALSKPFANAICRFRSDGSAIQCVQRARQEPRGLSLTEDGQWLAGFQDSEPIGILTLPEQLYKGMVGISPPPLVSHLSGLDAKGSFAKASNLSLLTHRLFPDVAELVLLTTGTELWIAGLERIGFPPETRGWAALYQTPDPFHHPTRLFPGWNGAVLILDAYGDAESENRRLYRLTKPNNRRPRIRQDVSSLIESLRSDLFHERMHAQRLLIEAQDPSVSDALLEILNDPDIDAHGLDAAALHSIGVLDGLQLIHADHPEILAVIEQAMRHPSAPVRRQAILTYPSHLLSDVADMLEPVDDDSPEHVFALLKAMAAAPTNDTFGQMAFERIQNQPWLIRSPFLRQAMVLVGARHAEAFLGTLLENSTARELEIPQFMSITEQVASHFHRTADADALHDMRALAKHALPELRETFLAARRHVGRQK